MPYKGLPVCDCVDLYRDYWLIKSNSFRYRWIQCKHCGKVRKTFSKSRAAFSLEPRPKNWKELLDPLVAKAQPAAEQS